MTRDILTIKPPLLADATALDDYLGNFPNVYAERAYPAIDLKAWLALGEDAGEPTYAIAQCLGLPLVRLERISAQTDALALIPPDLARRLRAVPLRLHKGLLAVAMEDPSGPDAQRLLDFLSRERVLPLVASPLQIREAIARHYDQVEDRAMALQLGLDTDIIDAQSPSEQEAQRLALEMPVVSMVHTLIADAVSRRASDIHLRPGETATDVLFRIDDELVPVRRLARALNPAVVSRIKVLAGMNLAEHRRPQDGRTTFHIDEARSVDLRISLLPTVFGESIVIRLLDTTESLWNLDELGLSESDRGRVEDVMARSHGMFLATGPTGCGKSTTLYAMLMELRKQRINILTIEDPVEFHIADIQQMQVNRAAGFTFASAMRNFLRHDPDVIMVGEIRDRETADIAVESALTGHLMLSTLHTNTAATTVTRLLDLGVESYLLRTSLLAVISQRLVRLTCQHCRIEEAVDMHVRETLGVAADEKFQIGRGCHHCEGLGVFRRQAVYELMVMTPRLRRLIVPGADADALHEAAIAEGMIPITQAAVALARSGAISLTEAWRVRAE
ncbi:GspE/PulE family protein [Dokdonella immobilis]|uniref:Type IV pilus assembly protein PilB n=1 Tax=Dokdonella immobilis TaxID=578942 RepID=A0A1I5A9D7_9GAMM|nr:GspE/PulE family protein [Dokdonella immobilis]SFN59043.1 type IV pilus assembly protein PilB [Dokdonella immobilis]